MAMSAVPMTIGCTTGTEKPMSSILPPIQAGSGYERTLDPNMPRKVCWSTKDAPMAQISGASVATWRNGR